jgi:hypothetical protein
MIRTRSALWFFYVTLPKPLSRSLRTHGRRTTVEVDLATVIAFTVMSLLVVVATLRRRSV